MEQQTEQEEKIESLTKQELSYIVAYPPQSYRCKHIDLNKSKPFIAPNGLLDNRNGLPFCTKIERYLVDSSDLLNFLTSLDLDEYTVNCGSCGLELAKYYVEKDTKGSQDGILGLRYTQHLMSYRPREDGLLGLECICGEADTRLSDEEKENNPTKFAENALSCGFDEAKFNDKDGSFTAIKNLIN